MRAGSDEAMADGSGECEKPSEMRRDRALDESERSEKSLLKRVLRRRLPPASAFEGEEGRGGTEKASALGSAERARPEATARRTRDDLVAGNLDERDGLGVARLEPDGRARSDVEPLEEGLFAVERHGAVHLAEVEVRADLCIDCATSLSMPLGEE